VNRKLVFAAITAALAGFLFGFDTVVISGAERPIQELWGLSDWAHGLAISMALWGTVLGSLVGGAPTERFGRRQTLIAIGVLYLASALWSGFATDVYSFMIARFIGGLGVGISTIAAPLYISEISPPEQRGRLAGMFQFNIVFGILIAYLSNYIIKEWIFDSPDLSGSAWRWMLAVEAFPAALYAALCFGIPKSPRWLIANRNDRATATAILRALNPSRTDVEIESLVDEIERSAQRSHLAKTKPAFWTSRLRIPILLAFLIAFFNQMSGINAILYFAPRIFQLAGLGENAALLNSIGLGATNLIFTFVGLALIDHLGRKTLLLIGSFGYIATLGICTLAFFANATSFDIANKSISLQAVAEKNLPANMPLNLLPADRNRRTDNLEQAIREYNQVVEMASDNVTGRSSYQNVPIQSSPETAIQVADETLQGTSSQTGMGSLTVTLCIFGFIAAHAVGQGAVIWVLISEVFPNRHRAAGQALGSFTHWIFAALIAFVFPVAIGALPPYIVFAFFCGMMVLQLIWVVSMMPETKGISLEDMEKRLLGDAE
jgi:sugar porter (SP) family MFS transporter